MTLNSNNMHVTSSIAIDGSVRQRVSAMGVSHDTIDALIADFDKRYHVFISSHEACVLHTYLVSFR